MTIPTDQHHRQIDGLGSGISSLSKVCIVSPSTRSSADIDYTFAAVGITSSEVDFSGNCGNMLSAIGPFAYNQGLVPRSNKPTTTIRIYNTNTNKLIHSTFTLTADRHQAATTGKYPISGVPTPGSQINLSFLHPSGSKTGTLLPTGNPIDTLSGIHASCIDAATPCIFIRAADIGLSGSELPNDPVLSTGSPILSRLEELRRLGAKAMGITSEETGEVPSAVPKIAVVSTPIAQTVLGDGAESKHDLRGEGLDIVVRVLSHRRPHAAIPLTVAVCTAVAATVKESVVYALLRPRSVERVKKERVVRIAHPSGVIEVRVEAEGEGNVREVSVQRTARLIMEGRVYY